MTKKLNLGCGEFKKDGYVNVDFHSVLESDVKHDLNEFPYPCQSIPLLMFTLVVFLGRRIRGDRVWLCCKKG